MDDSIIKFVEQNRTAMTKIFAVIMVLILLLSNCSWDACKPFDYLLEWIGIFLLAVSAFGRLWASLYISGHKIDQIICEGPYSIVRHPLYVFTFIGMVGIGLVAGNVFVLAGLVMFFFLIYPLVIISEERELIKIHGETYLSYMRTVPRFLPKVSLLNEPVSFNVHAIIYRKAIFDAIWFIWCIIPFKVIGSLHQAGILPIYF